MGHAKTNLEKNPKILSAIDFEAVNHRDHRLIYFSRTANRLRRFDVRKILQSSKTNNEMAGITGALALDGKYFLQVLEGEREALNRTFRRIHADARHTNVSLISFGPIDRRRYGSWSMLLIGSDRITVALCRQACGTDTFRPDLLSVHRAEALLSALMTNQSSPAALHEDNKQE